MTGLNNRLPGVLVINDSPVARAVIVGVIQASEAFQIVGQASGGWEGVELACRVRPDLVVLDIHMPDITGVEVTRQLVARCSSTRILLCSATVTRNAGYLVEALQAGAVDYVRTPSLSASPGQVVTPAEMRAAGATLLAKLHSLWMTSRASLGNNGPRNKAAPGKPLPVSLPKVVAIGSSTGGPSALGTLLKAIDPFAGVILISQHIEEAFTEGLAQWLSHESGHSVSVARNGDLATSGQVYLAKGGRHHLTISGSGWLRYEAAEEVVYYPNIDVMFRSVAQFAGARACAVVLTGMGDDGAAGAGAVREAGGRVLVQDPAEAVVDGMPRAVLNRGATDQALPLRKLAQSINQWLED